MADLLRLYSGKSWYPKFDLKDISMSKALKTYRDVGQKAFSEIMVHQTTKQLNVNVVWGKGKVIDKNTVEVDGKRYSMPGDFAKVEADGTLTLLGRGSVCINSGGEKIYPEEVEAALKSHPVVFDAMVVGLRDERWGEKVTAVV